MGKAMTLGNWRGLDNWFDVFTYPFHVWAWFITVCLCYLSSVFTCATSATTTARTAISQHQHFQIIWKWATSWESFRHCNSPFIREKNQLPLGKYTLVTCIIQILDLRRCHLKSHIQQISQQGHKIAGHSSLRNKAIPILLQVAVPQTIHIVFPETAVSSFPYLQKVALLHLALSLPSLKPPISLFYPYCCTGLLACQQNSEKDSTATWAVASTRHFIYGL